MNQVSTQTDESFFEKRPQSVLVSGSQLEHLDDFVERWAAHILQCSRLQVKSHPDYWNIYPTNKMRQINVDSIRELNRNIFVSANQGGNKVFVIHEADRLHVSAANALLKTLEEPPADTSIFLLTTRPYDVLATLRSRCWWVSRNENVGSNNANNAWEHWLNDFQKYLQKVLQTQRIEIIPTYGLLYRFQAYLNEHHQEDSKNDKDEDPEVAAANQARQEKQLAQQCFQDIEKVISTLFQERDDTELLYLYPLWIENLEKCFGRTEVNFGIPQSLEAFLFKLEHLFV